VLRQHETLAIARPSVHPLSVTCPPRI